LPSYSLKTTLIPPSSPLNNSLKAAPILILKLEPVNIIANRISIALDIYNSFRAFKAYRATPILLNHACLHLNLFTHKVVQTHAVIKERQGSEGTIRLKCPKRIINMLGIPEKGYLTVHIKGYHRERVRYGVTGSSMRINLGAGFNDLFTDEGNRIIATFKLSENGLLELFYKEDEVSRYCLRKK
jgi:hypothetical protein